MRYVSIAEMLFRLTDEEVKQDMDYLVKKDEISSIDARYIVNMKDHAKDLAGALYMIISQGQLNAFDDVLYAAKSIISTYEDSDLKYRVKDYEEKRKQWQKEEDESLERLRNELKEEADDDPEEGDE